VNELSARAKRMARHHGRARSGSGLNLVSLMDIFTILVFFLLVNSSEVQELPSTKAVQMPESISRQKPRETVTVIVGRDAILVQGESVLSVADALAYEGHTLMPLKDALGNQAARLIGDASPAALEVTIIGDRDLPYSLLRKVMATCTEADYGRVSLAVRQRSPGAAGVET
jgi:biopolymer transport protein ExbD